MTDANRELPIDEEHTNYQASAALQPEMTEERLLYRDVPVQAPPRFSPDRERRASSSGLPVALFEPPQPATVSKIAIKAGSEKSIDLRMANY